MGQVSSQAQSEQAVTPQDVVFVVGRKVNILSKVEGEKREKLSFGSIKQLNLILQLI